MLSLYFTLNGDEDSFEMRELVNYCNQYVKVVCTSM